jgi:hypothetical protein
MRYTSSVASTTLGECNFVPLAVVMFRLRSLRRCLHVSRLLLILESCVRRPSS